MAGRKPKPTAVKKLEGNLFQIMGCWKTSIFLYIVLRPSQPTPYKYDFLSQD